MQVPAPELKAASIAVPGALVAWFAETLPVVQWWAGAGAIVVSVLAVIRAVRRRK